MWVLFQVSLLSKKMLKILLILISSLVFADNSEHQVSFKTTKTQKVANDVMLVNMKIEQVDKNLDNLNASINKKTHQLENILKNLNVEFKTTNYYTSPQYYKKRIKNWRGVYSFSIESKNFTKLNTALKQLQNIANYQSLSFFVSDEKREQIYNQLLSKAILEHKQKAKNIASSFGAQEYSFKKTNFNTIKTYPQYERKMMLMSATSSSPSSSAGKSDVQININSTIELK